MFGAEHLEFAFDHAGLAINFGEKGDKVLSAADVDVPGGDGAP